MLKEGDAIQKALHTGTWEEQELGGLCSLASNSTAGLGKNTHSLYLRSLMGEGMGFAVVLRNWDQQEARLTQVGDKQLDKECQIFDQCKKKALWNILLLYCAWDCSKHKCGQDWWILFWWISSSRRVIHVTLKHRGTPCKLFLLS